MPLGHAHALTYPKTFARAAIAANGTKLYVRVGGLGPAVVLLHQRRALLMGSLRRSSTPLTAYVRRAKSGSFIEAAGIANDIVREEIMPQNQLFEIPQQLRELAERNVEQARTAYGQLMDAMAQATGMWMSAMPSNEMTSGFKVVRERAIQFAKQNAEACFAAASELGNAKDIQDLLAIQSRSAQTQMQAYALQAQELGRLMVEAAQSVQPRS
jgi:hypothetical protein